MDDEEDEEDEEEEDVPGNVKMFVCCNYFLTFVKNIIPCHFSI